MMSFNREQLHRLATDAGMDAANRHMRKAGRTAWDESDYAVACETFEKVYGSQRGGGEMKKERINLQRMVYIYADSDNPVADLGRIKTAWHTCYDRSELEWVEKTRGAKNV